MKKLTFDYYGWTLVTILILMFAIMSIALIKFGYNHTSAIIVDLTGVSMIVIGTLWLAYFLWEIRLLINFITTDFHKSIIITDSEFKLINKGKCEIYRLSELIEVELVGEIIGHRSITKDLTYSKFRFANKDQVVVTSFISPIYEIKKLFGNKGIKFIEKNRKPFELIK